MHIQLGRKPAWRGGGWEGEQKNDSGTLNASMRRLRLTEVHLVVCHYVDFLAAPVVRIG